MQLYSLIYGTASCISAFGTTHFAPVAALCRTYAEIPVVS